ncbi:MAG: hypothetical protein HC897_07835 [Thermoanaerobaculia bacterium]|nr:hypothetical protein [Thermoanaerobaculia bacterium]
MQEAALLDQILSGQNRQLQLLAAAGLVPLPPEQLIPIQVALTQSPDPEVADKAAGGLELTQPNLAASFLSNQAGEAELRWFGTRSRQTEILEAIVRRRDAPRRVLVEMAPLLGPEIQEILILRQDAIIEEPQILIALETNPQLSSYVKRRIWEYREHLLPRDKLPPKPVEELMREVDALTDEEVAEAIAEVKQLRPDEKAHEKVAEEVEEEGLLSVGQVRGLPVPVRVKLARGANRQMRAILVRDSNVQVALAVIKNNPLNDAEVEMIANSKVVVEDVLVEISRNREWTRRYPVIRALARNPKTQLPIALRFVKMLTTKDLREISRDRNVPGVIRSTALRLYQEKAY